MIFKFDCYRDLGKCAYATLMETFDTEKNKIFLRDKEVKINTLEDLFPYLWNIPGCEVRDKNSSRSVFYDQGYWWNRYYGDSKSESIQRMIKRLDAEVVEQQQQLIKLNENSSVK